MIVGKLMDAAMAQALNEHQDVHRQWISAIHKFAGRFGVGMVSMAGDTRFDILLRSIESETVQRLQQAEQATTFVYDMQIKLSETWILSMYEILRSGYEQARQREIDATDLKVLRDKFALVRVPLAKYEIAWADRLKPEIELSRRGDGPDVPTEPYRHDATYIIPRAFNTENGSIQWHAIDLRGETMVWINRRELADELLAFFEKDH